MSGGSTLIEAFRVFERIGNHGLKICLDTAIVEFMPTLSSIKLVRAKNVEVQGMLETPPIRKSDPICGASTSGTTIFKSGSVIGDFEDHLYWAETDQPFNRKPIMVQLREILSS